MKRPNTRVLLMGILALFIGAMGARTAQADPLIWTITAGVGSGGNMVANITIEHSTNTVLAWAIDFTSAFLGDFTLTDSNSTLAGSGLGAAGFTYLNFETGYTISPFFPDHRAYFFFDSPGLSPAGGTLLLGGGLTALNSAGANDAGFLNPFSVTFAPASAVPEPGTLLLLSGGLLGLGLARKRNRS